MLIYPFCSSFSETIIRGFVRDSITGQAISFANVCFNGSDKIQRTSNFGFFEITDSVGRDTIIVSFKNYKTKKVPVNIDRINALDILLLPWKDDPGYLAKTSGRQSYDEENNPAIHLIQKVIENKNTNRIENLPSYKYQQYEKSVISVDEILKALKSNKILKKFETAYNDLEVSDFSGQPILTISMKEILSEEYRKKDPKTEKTVIIAENHEGVDRSTIAESLAGIWNETFNDINIFEDNITFLLKEIVSPLSPTHATKNYKYYIGDTVQYKNQNCVTVDFTPHLTDEARFTGRFWITLDGNYNIIKVILNIPHGSGFNYINQLQINQEFEKEANEFWVKSHSSTAVEFDNFKVLYGLYVKRELFFYDYNPAEPSDPAFQFSDDVVMLKDSENQTDSFWIANRPIPLPVKSQSVKEAESAFSHSPLFRGAIFSLKVLTSGYVQTNGSKDKNKFNIGPIGTFFSVNEIEGMRFKLGGETTSNLSKYFYLKGFGAYGTKDNKFKYSGKATWSFNGKHPDFDYGINTLSFSYQYDVNTPGEQFFFANKDNVLLSFKHTKDDKMTYQRKGTLLYEKEYENGFMISGWTKFQTEQATGSLQFLTADSLGNIADVGSYNSSEIGIRLRYVHSDIFYQRRNARIPVFHNAPVFYLTYYNGIKGYLNGEYNYQFAEFAIGKTFWSPIGHFDFLARTGKIWGSLPFPLLILPNANQSYSIQPYTYNMLTPIEFINDKFVSLDAGFHFNGILLGKVPILRKLNMREVVTFKGLYGDLSDKNLPENNPDLFLFPENSRTMGKDPYMEVSIGIENIFKMLRIDYVRRLTYLNDPGISKNGVRFALRFSF